MVTASGNVLTPNLFRQLIALRGAARTADELQLQLATGKKVNSALDNPQNFFASKALNNRANDLSRLLDGINLNIRTIQAADAGVGAVKNIIEQAESYAIQARETLTAASDGLSLQEQILADDPIAYYQLNEESGNVAENLGSGGAAINGVYQNNVSLSQEEIYFTGNRTASFDGTFNTRVAIPDSLLINTDPAEYPQRTIELVFRANNTQGRQVLYEEGGTVNAIAIYIDNGRIYTTARDAGDFGPFNISAPIEANETYHVALSLDAPNQAFTGYLNGDVIGTGVVTKPLARHTANIAIGGLNQDTFFHDGSQSGNGLNFNGQIADVALYNDVIDQEGIRNRYASTLLDESKVFQEEVSRILLQLDPLVEDASFRGVNLLNNDNLITVLSEKFNNDLVTEGVDFTVNGLGLDDAEFYNPDRLDKFLDELRAALKDVRGFGLTLANDLSIIETFDNFTTSTINTLNSGADDLVVADQNKLGAELLALQTRQTIQATVVSLTAQANQTVLQLF